MGRVRLWALSFTKKQRARKKGLDRKKPESNREGAKQKRSRIRGAP